MKITFEMDKESRLAGDVALDALWYAYRLGQTGQELYMVGFSGCEENKNFCIVLDVKELL
jgi:hypothetical protein